MLSIKRSVFPALAACLLSTPSAFAAEGQECIDQVKNPETERVDCLVNFQTNADSARQIREVTGDAVLAAKCELKIDVDRQAVFDQIEGPGTREFQVPPQTGKCTFFTSKAPMSPEFSVSPKVTFVDSRATDLVLNAKFTKNVPPAIGQPVENWVNSDAKFRAKAVKEINKFLDGMEEQE